MKQQKDKYALDWAARYMEKRSELALQSPDTHQSQQSSFKTSQEIFALASQYVFVVIATGSQDIAQGSAVAISPFELITNCHVVSGRSVIALYSGGNGIEAEVKHEDITGDRCTIRTKTPLSHFAEIRSFSSVEIGEKVYSIGSPHGLDLGLGLTMADGIISGKRADGVNRYLQTTAAISKGSSGGGLFDSAGRLVGVTTFTLNDGQNLNFAVPAEDYEK